MPKYVSKEKMQELIATLESFMEKGYLPPGEGNRKKSCLKAAGEKLGLTTDTILHRLASAKLHYGLTPNLSKYTPPVVLDEQIIKLIGKKTDKLDELAAKFKFSEKMFLKKIYAMQDRGYGIHIDGNFVYIDHKKVQLTIDKRFTFYSDKNDEYLLGACGDTHLGSKYERLDCLEDYYRLCQEAGVKKVFHAGNYIDGESKFNRMDIHTHGMDAQLRYLAKYYPERQGIETFAVDGDDHEGWYSQREGVNVGKMAEQAFRDEGRQDWFTMGYQTCHIRLINSKSGAEAIYQLEHPGGGSAYADSYSIQKIIEAIEGGEKPAVYQGGHYHKLMAGEYRNVWYLQSGCFVDRGAWARKMKLRYSIGGLIVKLRQDPRTGGIVGFSPEMIRYFSHGTVNGQVSMSGKVKKIRRGREHV